MKNSRYWIAIAVLLAAGGGAYALYRVSHDGRVAAQAPISASKLSAPVASDKDAPPVRLVKNPMQAPPMELLDLDGNAVSSSNWNGKVVLVNFWATWCPPCRMEIPELIGLQNAYGDRLQVIGISEDEDPPEKVRAFAKEKGINYPIVMATPELIASYGGVPALPTTFVVDTHGNVVQKHAGLYPEDAYHREIKVLLNLPTEVRVETFEDTGQVFLKNIANATELPGVDLSHLSAAQKKVALRRMNAESCTCGCGLTVAQCRVNDSSCPTSSKIAAQIVAEVQQGKQAAPDVSGTP